MTTMQRNSRSAGRCLAALLTVLFVMFAAPTPGAAADTADTAAQAAQPKRAAPRRIDPSRSVIKQQAPVITGTILKIVEGSGEFEFLKDAVNVTERQVTKFQWTTNQASAASGRWEVRNISAGGLIVATGVSAPAPAVGHFQRFTIPANAYLLASPPASDVKFEVTIRPYDAANQPLGAASTPVVVTQVSGANIAPPTQFDSGAVFPSLEIVSYKENIGIVPNTQIYFAYADVKIRASNKGTKKTDPMWLSVKDHNLLLRQNAPVSAPQLNPNATKTFDIRLDAILPPPRSQTPQAAQHAQWRADHKDRCGAELRGVLDWRGPQSQTPIDAHRETLLAMSGWADYATIAPSTPICDATQCVKVCDIEKNVRAALDGRAVGYAFFAGQYPKFGAGGKARTSADGVEIDFTSKTKITVASVAKLVTAIAAVRILDQNNVSLDDPVGPYFPYDWDVGTYFQNVTFAQFLSQQSGIKDYGNVDMTYGQLRSFFTQTVDNNSTAMCTGSGVQNPPNAVTPANMSACYSNYNFAIFRVLLPKVAGFAEDSNQASRPQTLANQYEALTRQNVFDRVGQPGVACKPPSGGGHAFAYNYPGAVKGKDWGDVSLTCGAAGWYLSIEDMAKALLSLNARDGKIFVESATESQFDDLRARGLGLDINTAAQMEKNGGWGAGCDSNGEHCGSISTTAGIFGPVTGPRVIGILFINSEISGGPNSGESARQVLQDAYNKALTPK